MRRTPEPTVFIHAYGCQMNKLDAELILSALAEAGYAATDDMSAADVILFCTCSVRRHAEERVFSNVGKLKLLKKLRPETVIGVLGCMAQRDPDEIRRRAPHVDIVCGTRAFPRIAEFVEAARRGEGPIVATDEDSVEMPHRNTALRPSRFQAFVSVMRGCDNFCAYCIVPYVRGREISRPMNEVVEEVRRLADDGVREVTLLGQNVNSYGKSLGRKGALADLLERVDAVDGIARIRFVTSQPKDMSRHILEAMAGLPTVCESVHMPAQSGCDRVLRAMRRGYTAQQYRDLVAEAREIIPGIAIAGDFIVGFPGETEPEFDQTAEFVRDVRFRNCFVFKYSTRPGTKAAELADDVALVEKKRRNNELLAIQERVSLEAHRGMIGREFEALVEGPSKKNPAMLTGRLRTDHIVHFPGRPSLAGRLVRVRVRDATPLTLSGEAVPGW